MAGTESSPPVIVCDAGPLIRLDQIGCADLLSDFPRVLVPKTVWEEVARHRSAALTQPKLSLERVSGTAGLSAELDALIRLLGLHRGEQEALQVAQANPGCLLLTDDTAARLAARAKSGAARTRYHWYSGARSPPETKVEAGGRHIVTVSAHCFYITRQAQSAGRNHPAGATIGVNTERALQESNVQRSAFNLDSRFAE
jgi:hypothetical protein